MRVARRALHAAGRAVLLAWALAVVGGFATAIAAVLITWYLATDDAAPVGVWTMWSLITLALLFDLTAYRPQRTEPPGLPVTAEDAAPLRNALQAELRWSPSIRVSLDPRICVDRDTLVIGVPYLALLTRAELLGKLRWVYESSAPERTGPLATAFWIADGRLPRGALLSRWLMRPLGRRIERLREAYSTHGAALHEVQHDATCQAHDAALRTAHEIWAEVAVRWLEPALREEAWHSDLSTPLRALRTACEDAGLLERTRPRDPAHEASGLVHHLAVHERALMAATLADAHHDPEPTDWADHPHRVTERAWRRTFAQGLDAARQSTGEVPPATWGAMLALFETGWGPTITAVVTGPTTPAPPASESLADAESPERLVRVELLTAATFLALVDSGIARPEWSWLQGTVLRHRDGREIHVAEVVAAYDTAGDLAGLRGWATWAGIDPDAPLWLDGGTTATREAPLWMIETFRGLRSFHLVVSDQALRLFPQSAGRATVDRTVRVLADDTSMFHESARAVAHGDLSGQTGAVAFADVVHATLTPMPGGHWWRLRVRTADGGLTFWGYGTGRRQDPWFRDILGDRLHTRWLGAPRWVFALRSIFGFLCLGVGGLVAIAGGMLVASPETGTTRLNGLGVVALGLLVVAAAMVPDLVAAAVHPRRPVKPGAPRPA